VAELRIAWDRVDATLLPIPAEHPSLPRPPSRSVDGRPAVSQAD